MIVIHHRRSKDIVLIRIPAELLDGIDLSGSYLRGADLKGRSLRAARLRESVLNGANLSGAYLHGADLSRAHLLGADFSEAVLTDAKLDGAIYDGHTIWPVDFDPSVCGASKDSEEMSGSKGGRVDFRVRL